MRQKDYDTSTRDELRRAPRRRGVAKKGWEGVLDTRLSAMDALDRIRPRVTQDELPDAAQNCNRVDEIHRALAPGDEVVKARAQWLRPRLREMRRAAVCSPHGGGGGGDISVGY